MFKQHLIVEVVQSEKEKDLLNQIECLKVRLESQKKMLNELSAKWREEVYLNNQIIDILKENNIEYRSYLDNKERIKYEIT